MKRVGSSPDRNALKKPYTPPADGQLSRSIEELISCSYMLGMDHSSSKIQAADDEPPVLAFKEAVEAIKSRVSLTKAEWKALEPELRFRAFTVARLSSVEAIERVRTSAVAAVEKGTPFDEFWTKASAEATAGISKASPWYWETVFRTNVQTAYNTGRAAEFMRTQPEYLEFIGIEDDRQTEICAARSGVIRPATDPWWQSNWPPLHFNCRSTVRAVSQEEIDVMREEDPDFEITSEKGLESVEEISGSAADGFGGNPLSTSSFYQMTPQMVERAESYGLLDEIRGFSREIGLKYDPVSVSELKSEGRVVDIPGDVPASNKASQRAMKKVLENYKKTSFKLTDLGEDVYFDKRGIEHAIHFSADPLKLQALQFLPAMFQKAKVISTEPFIGTEGFSDLVKARIASEIGGQSVQYELILRRKISDGSLVFYDLIPYRMK